MTELGNDLLCAENSLVSRYHDSGKMEFPVVLVMGPLRSGTTLFTQWLANTDLVSYPSNFLSRFYQSPIIGAKIQLLLTDPRYSFRNELSEFTQPSDFKSDNGKTQGVLAPNEFWYFWRRFLAEHDRDVWSDNELAQSMDTQGMLAELAGMMDVFQKPFAAKGMLFNYNIPFLDSLFDKALFIQIKRDPVANVASVLDARKRQLDSTKAWYSFKIPEYEQLTKLDPTTQCAGQIHYINKAVSQGLAQVAESRKLVVQYEDFCESPKKIFEQLTVKLKNSALTYSGPDCFTISRSIEADNRDEIEHALHAISL